MQNTKKKPYSCTHVGCSSSFDRPYKLVQHSLTHKDIKLFTCAEPLCHKSYSSKSHLDRHVRSSHIQTEKDILYSCPTCLKTYANRQNLKRHMQVHKKLLLCDICKAEFKKKHQLSAHMFQHTGVKSFSCEKCYADFVTITDKKRHMRHHKTYNCSECSSNFVHWSKYLYHQKMEHSQNEYTCNECGRNFKQRCHIIRHIKIHDTSRKFPCTYDNCNRVYTNNSNLKQHILIKHVKMMLKCEICEMELANKGSLVKHLNGHANPKTRSYNPKTLATGRRERKDKGIPKLSALASISGITADILLKHEKSCIVNDENVFGDVKIKEGSRYLDILFWPIHINYFYHK